jgi:putative flippase GtrA
MTASSPPLLQRLPAPVRRFWPFVKFCLVGLANTAISYVVYLGLIRLMPYAVANVVGWFVGVCFSFFANCWFTWHVRPTWRRFIPFPLSSLPNVILSTGGVVLLVEVFGMDKRIAPLFAMLVAVPISYLLAKAILTRPHTPAHGGRTKRSGRRREPMA